MDGNQGAVSEDLHLVGQRVHLNNPFPGGIWNAVEIAPTLTIPSWETLRSNLSAARNEASGNAPRWVFPPRRLL
ncbi:hypothetical protein CP49_22125 [Bradyrhizobium valentinum]|jgi:hypothetical protein|uniref:Uncharacterized protein n=1 Tax=Bradyrhizobium valentinum TaxID=1518501 RepID=A0A0R3LS46_9BRAD|nr:hypothetical protein CP49_22125 [Bradyrhizobium valentinum]